MPSRQADKQQTERWVADPLGETVSRLEGRHRGTKADLADAMRNLDRVETRLTRWFIAIVGLGAAVVILVDQLAGG